MVALVALSWLIHCNALQCMDTVCPAAVSAIVGQCFREAGSSCLLRHLYPPCSHQSLQSSASCHCWTSRHLHSTCKLHRLPCILLCFVRRAALRSAQPAVLCCAALRAPAGPLRALRQQGAWVSVTSEQELALALDDSQPFIEVVSHMVLTGSMPGPQVRGRAGNK